MCVCVCVCVCMHVCALPKLKHLVAMLVNTLTTDCSLLKICCTLNNYKMATISLQRLEVGNQGVIMITG